MISDMMVRGLFQTFPALSAGLSFWFIQATQVRERGKNCETSFHHQ